MPATASTPAPRLGGRRLAACAVALVALSTGAREAAADALPSNDYAIDLFQGPILAPLRVIGMAGSYAGYAEGIAGFVANAAAPAVREPYSVDAIEWDIAASLSIPFSLFDNSDFDNSGGLDFDYSNFVFVTGGALLQVNRFAIGASAEFQSYALTGVEGTTNITVGKSHVLGAARLLGGQLMLGAGARIVTLGIVAPGTNLTFVGAAPEFGMLLRPDFQSFRVGATFRAPVSSTTAFGGGSTTTDGVERAGGLVLPRSAVLPWELEVGVAVQVGPRPLNPEWLDPSRQSADLSRLIEAERKERAKQQQAELDAIEDPNERVARAAAMVLEEAKATKEDRARRERGERAMRAERKARYANWPREHLLVTAEVLMTGPVERGVSIERFLGQNQPRDPTRIPVLGPPGHDSVIGTSGADVSFSPRFGVETEPVLMLVHTRFGSYYEPSRFDRVGRQHFTFGSDLRAFTTTWFDLVPEVTYKLMTSLDIAPRYESYSVGIGVWH